MVQTNPIELFVPELREGLKAKDLDGLQILLRDINPIDLAEAFHEFTPEEQILLWRLLDRRRKLIVLEELSLHEQQHIIRHIEDPHAAEFLKDVAPHRVRRLMHSLSKESVKKIEAAMETSKLAEVNKSPVYPSESAGALMQPGLPPLKPNQSAREALDYLRHQLHVRHEEDTSQGVFVVNERDEPIGVVTLRTLIAAPLDAKISELMTPSGLIRIRAGADREEASKIFSRYKLQGAPVVDDQDRLVGTLLASDMLRVLQQEATEDIQKLGAVETLDEPYFRMPFLKMVRKRGAWLCVLFIGEMLTATAMGFFEKEIAKAVVLALFIPLIISSGGNSGSQAATLIVRAMALKEISLSDWWKVMRRELLAGLSLGCILGTLGFLRIFVWSQFTSLYGPHYLFVALTVACALVLVVMWGSLSGSLLPILLSKLGLDPAVVSAPFVATLVDVTGLVIYFVTGMVLLKGTLL